MHLDRTFVTVCILGIVVSVSVFYVLFALANRSIDAANQILLTEQEQLQDRIATTADTLRRNGTNEAVQSLFSTCDSDTQTRFDELLGRLSLPIPKADVGELHILFHRCAYAPAWQRLALALQLQRDVELWSELQAMTSTFPRALRSHVRADMTYWYDLAENERLIAKEAQELVRLQGIIIAEIMRGESGDATSIKDALAEVSNANTNINQLRNQNAALRQQIVGSQ